MTRTFASAAARLAGVVPRTLGWLPQSFWDATPAELAAIFQVRELEDGNPLTRAELAQLMERERNG